MPHLISNLIRHLSGNNLKARCARSSFCLGIGTISDRVLAFVRNMILTRLLFPREMGVMVIILSLKAFFDVLIEVGIKQSIIQNRDGAKPGYLNAAWWFQGVRSVILYIMAFTLTPLACHIFFSGKPEILEQYSWPQLHAMVRVTLASILFNGLLSPRACVLEKEFHFGKAVILMQGSSILGIVITLVLAFHWQNIWALVIGVTCTSLVQCVLSYILCPFLPRFTYDRESFGELFRFARGIFGSPLLAYFGLYLDVLVAGRLIASDLFGMYGMAVILARTPRDLFARIVAPVLLPAFSETQNKKKTVRQAVLKLTLVTSLLGSPVAIIGTLCGCTILSIVYGTEYSVVGLPFGLLCISFLLLIQAITLTTVLMSIGQPAKHRLFVAIRVAVLASLIYPATKTFGLIGAASAVLTANVIAICFQVFAVRRGIGLRIRDYIMAWIPGLIAAIPVLAMVIITQKLAPTIGLLHLSVGLALWAILCLALFFLRERLGLLDWSRCTNVADVECPEHAMDLRNYEN
jgi:O-antigen/teichoic acid export membrane protein